MFGGSIRYNLDPFGYYNDDKIWNTLEHVRLIITDCYNPYGYYMGIACIAVITLTCMYSSSSFQVIFIHSEVMIKEVSLVWRCLSILLQEYFLLSSFATMILIFIHVYVPQLIYSWSVRLLKLGISKIC